MRKFALWMLALGIVASAGDAFARRVTVAKYGMQGCGVGSMIWANPETDYDDKAKQIVGALLDGYLGFQTYAMTSGTLNCRHKRVRSTADTFIDINSQALRMEAVQGDGETIAGLELMLNCEKPGVIGNVLRANYESVFANDQSSNPESVGQRIRETLKQNTSIQTNCSNLS